VNPNSNISPLALLVRVNCLQGWRRLKAIRDQSRLLTALIGTFICGYLGLAFYLFYRGMEFAERFPGLGGLLVERLLFVLFAFLFVLLLFSNLVITYTNLFKNRETSFLLTLPVRPEVIYQWKFLESVALASWAFLFLIAPLLAAFGITRQVAWHFYPMTVVLVTMAVVLPGVAGAYLAIILARYMERRAFQLLVLGGSAALLLGAIFWLKPEPMPPDSTETRVLLVLDKMLGRTRFAEMAFLPSYWLSASVLNWAEGALAAAGFFALVLASHVLLWGYLSFTQLGQRFYDAASAVQSRGSVFGQWEWFRAWRRRQKEHAWESGPLEAILKALRPIPDDVRALVVKDFRMFWRDTTQWGQTIMLFGLLGVYIINLRHFTSQLTNPFWIHLVSYLNLGACALNLATLTTRFVFPQFSLEGKRLWIIGLAPLGLLQVLRAKFWMASLASLVLTLGLIALSCHMLHLPWHRTAFFAAAITIMTFTLTGLAVGLGTLYPNFKEDNPGKIVSGFGGTFCLVLSFVYILASVVVLALGSPWAPARLSVEWLKLWSWLFFLALSLALGWLPMRLAIRRVATLEI
jgi:ABC-2 type transport system permease protein